MSAGVVTRRARRFVVASPVFLVAATVAMVVDVSSRVVVALVLYGFVFSMIFGKAYALVPSYFDTTLEPRWSPSVQLPLTVGGAMALAVTGVDGIPDWVGVVGAGVWGGGTMVFVGTIVWTIRDNLTGAATGTSGANEDRAGLDRVANAFLPVVMVYLFAGTYSLLATRTTLPSFGVGGAGTTHLFAAGGATLLVFVIGFRLFPRFLVTTPPRGLAPLVLTTGAVAPVVLATSLYGEGLFRVGAVLQAVAIVGFAVAYVVLFVRSDRDRIGLYGPLVGVGFGVLGVGIGTQIAFTSTGFELIGVHRRVNLVGFLGLTIIGASYQFYPPAVATFPVAGNRLAGWSMAGIGVGLVAQLVAVVGSVSVVGFVGELAMLGGAVAYAYILVGLVVQRRT